jgi:hypothetical protein
MIKVETIKKLLECAILSGLVKNKKNHVSVFIIADAESGKSEMIKIMSGYPNTYYTNDLSFKPFLDDILPNVVSEKITHILIPDYINILEHRRASESLTPVLNSFMAEGIKDLKYYGVNKVFPIEVKGGIITGITKQYFDRRIAKWRGIGFLSRMIPVTFRYSETTQQEIHEYIKKGGNLQKEYIKKKELFEKHNIRPNSINVEIPEDIAEKIHFYALGLRDQNKFYVVQRRRNESWGEWTYRIQNYGFRLHEQLRTLAQGICLYNKLEDDKKEFVVDEEDIKTLLELTKFTNFNFTEI